VHVWKSWRAGKVDGEEGDRRGLRMVRYVPFACAPVAPNSGKSPVPGTTLPEPELASPEP
jgi:hypothetical protein